MDKNEFKAKAKAKFVEAKTRMHYAWVSYKEEIIIFSIVGLPIAAKGIDSICKAVRSSNEEHHKLMMDYDPSMGWYNELKRPLTPQDKQKILVLREEGLNQTQALLQLGLLK